MSKIGHLRLILNGPSELDRPLLSRRKGGGEQLLGEGNGISLHLEFRVNMGASHCAGHWSLNYLAINAYHCLFTFIFYKALLYDGRDSWFCLYSICLRVDKDKVRN